MNIKKKFADLLCAPLAGKILVKLFNKRIPCLRNPRYRFSVPVKYSSSVIHASIFWGIYESAEIRLIKKHLRADLPVIELGGSLGIISSFIIRKLNPNVSLTVVEANPHLIESIKKNIEYHKMGKNSINVVNRAIGYLYPSIRMSVSSDNTASHVVEKEINGNETIEVECIQLRQIISSQQYSLVCDIEGAEIEILLYEKELMRNCKQLIIELHDTSHLNQYYSRETLLKMLINDGFVVKNKDGNVYFFERG